MTWIKRGDFSVMKNQIGLFAFAWCHNTSSEGDAARERAAGLQKLAACGFFYWVIFCFCFGCSQEWSARVTRGMTIQVSSATTHKLNTMLLRRKCQELIAGPSVRLKIVATGKTPR